MVISFHNGYVYYMNSSHNHFCDLFKFIVLLRNKFCICRYFDLGIETDRIAILKSSPF